ncbi:hypothetical protein KQI86_05860 [Clostridium sp. MSJ-11]|uniref:Holliday junction resolvase-related domain-containing protein n=1 Tax=Clostridium mobile TaxID=2841512 RepID=A0ABS6EHB1_9CLOT|nr:hypothetical protein [Clostridium mobile]MBU5483850.1 hypothetical protein [Clostridium mobile]
MNKEKNFLNTFNKFYMEKNKKKIKEIEKKNTEIEKRLKEMRGFLQSKQIELEDIEGKNNSIKEQYKRAKDIFFQRGITFTVINKGYGIKEWDNLLISKKSGLWIIQTKGGEDIKILDKEVSSLLEEILKDKNYSLVVTRIEDRFIKIKLHTV